MYTFLSAATTAFLLSVVNVSGFGVAPPLVSGRFSTSSPSSSSSKTTQLYGIRCENKYYQLEEMEDAENCTTELFLKSDGRVLVGQTDGPAWNSASGWWEVKPGTNDFRMVLTRSYKSGRSGTDMGEFEYDIPLTYLGEMTQVGESVAITGVMVAGTDVDFDTAETENAPGYFNMIDATDIREDRRADARVSSSN